MSWFFAEKKHAYEPGKVKANLKMSLTRVQQQKNKRTNNVRALRRHLAELLAANKIDEARVKVEGLIRDVLYMQGLDILVLFVELVSGRQHVIAESRTCPPELKEAVTSILWGVTRVDNVPEFHNLRFQFALKYGKSFCEAAAQNEELSVNEKLMEKLSTQVPAPSVCVQYLEDIAEEYGVDFDAEKLKREGAVLPEHVFSSGADASGAVSATTRVAIPPIVIPKDAIEARLLSLKMQ